MRALLPLLMLTGCSWPIHDRIAYGSFATCQAVDFAQTAFILDHGGVEANPLLGDYPKDEYLLGFKVASLMAGYALAELFPESRVWVIGAATVPCLGAVGWNYREMNRGD